MYSTGSGQRSSWRQQASTVALRLSLLLVLPATLAGGGHAPPIGDQEALDSGSFTLFVHGARIGEERFVIREDRAGAAGPIYLARGELNLKVDGSTMRINVALEALGSGCRPRRYEAEIDAAEPTTIVANLMRDRLRMDIKSAKGQEMKEFLVRGKTAILDRYIAHHYFFAAKLLGCESGSAAGIIVPRERNYYSARIVDQGEETVRVAGQELRLRHVTITPQGGSARHVWLDGDKVMKVHNPETGFLAERS